MSPWVALAISSGTTLVGVGIVFGMLRARAENNSMLIRELREYVVTQTANLREEIRDGLDEVKATRATVERVDAIVDRFDRFEEDLRLNLQEKFDDLKEAVRDLTARVHKEVTQTNRRIEE